MFPFAAEVCAQVNDNLLDAFRKMSDGFKALGLDPADVGDALGALEEMESFMPEPPAHLVGGLHREPSFLEPCRAHRLEEHRILKLATGRSTDPQVGRCGDELGEVIFDEMFLEFLAARK